MDYQPLGPTWAKLFTLLLLKNALYPAKNGSSSFPLVPAVDSRAQYEHTLHVPLALNAANKS